MELKRGNFNLTGTPSELLIVPYGIETWLK